MGIVSRFKSLGRMQKPIALALALGLLGAPSFGAGHDDGELRTFMFGHSLVNNGAPRSAVPYWLVQIARADQKTFRFAGRSAFLQGHAESLPPDSQWGFDGAPAVWDDQRDGFLDIDFDSVMLTAENFIQWLPPSEDMDWSDNSAVGHTLDIIDWVTNAEPGIEIVVYENWPEMNIEAFPPTSEEFSSYNAYTLGEFNNWWRAYEADLVAARPDVQITTIPVGQTIAKMLTQTDLLSGIPVTDLYYDGAPHGTPNIYFLASLITYAGLFEASPPSGINVPSDLHPVIRDNYDEIVRFIAVELGVG